MDKKLQIMIAGVLPKDNTEVLELYKCITDTCQIYLAEITSPVDTEEFIKEFSGSAEEKEKALALKIKKRVDEVDIIIGNFTHWPSEWKAYELWLAAAKGIKSIFIQKEWSRPISWVMAWYNNPIKIIYKDLSDLEKHLKEVLNI